MVFETVRAMIAKQLKADESKITRETRLVEDLKADSEKKGQDQPAVFQYACLKDRM